MHYLVRTDDVDCHEKVSHSNHPLWVANAEDDVALHTVSKGPVSSTGHSKVAPTNNSICHIHSSHHGDRCVPVGLGRKGCLQNRYVIKMRLAVNIL